MTSAGGDGEQEVVSAIQQRIEARIPDRWGPDLQCGPGWVALLGDLDAELSELFPDYVVYQCKQKFGGLRYYTDIGEGLARMPCCEIFHTAHPEPGMGRDDREHWLDLLHGHEASDDHVAALPGYQRDLAAAEAAITHAEQLSCQTCEQCGAPGTLIGRGWYRIACEAHRGAEPA